MVAGPLIEGPCALPDGGAVDKSHLEIGRPLPVPLEEAAFPSTDVKLPPKKVKAGLAPRGSDATCIAR